jgi:hypothetical protein
MLLLAVPSMWPYGYYELLRWVVCAVGAYSAYQVYKLNLKGWMIVMIAVAILFNPISPFTFSKGTWVFFDIVAAIVMFVVSSKFKKEVIETKKYE